MKNNKEMTRAQKKEKTLIQNSSPASNSENVSPKTSSARKFKDHNTEKNLANLSLENKVHSTISPKPSREHVKTNLDEQKTTPKRKRRRHKSRSQSNALQFSDNSATDDMKEKFHANELCSTPKNSLISNINECEKTDESLTNGNMSNEDYSKFDASCDLNSNRLENISKSSELKGETEIALSSATSVNVISPKQFMTPTKSLNETSNHQIVHNIKEEPINLDNTMALNNIKSPSGASVDSAKGSSIGNDLDCTLFTTGDLYWGRIHHFSYWACMVCPDDSEEDNPLTRLVDQQLEVHVRFFADNARHNWVKRENLIHFQGLECYRDLLKDLKEKFGVKSLKYQSLLPKRSKLKVWLEAVKEADIVANTPYPQRMKKFLELNEVARERNKEERIRRKSMSLARHNKVENNNMSETNINEDNTLQNHHQQQQQKEQQQHLLKRNRSESPVSPAFSPLRKLKRRKTTADATELMQVRKKTSVSSTSQSISSDDTFNNSLTSLNSSSQIEKLRPQSSTTTITTMEFENFHKMIKNVVMLGQKNELVERNLLTAVRNIWALKNIMEQQIMKQSSLNDMNGGSIRMTIDDIAKPIKRLSIRRKEIEERQQLELKNTSLNNSNQLNNSIIEQRRSINPPKLKKSLNRPIEEVIDDIFNLDSRYLFENMGRDPVCKYCFAPGGNLKRCSKSCTAWLHSKCLLQNSNHKSNNTKTKYNRHSLKKELAQLNQSQSTIPIMEHDNTLNTKQTMPHHVTADNDQQMENINYVNVENTANTSVDSTPLIEQIVCKECESNEKPVCLVCHSNKKYLPQNNGLLEETVMCNMTHCCKVFHPSCLKYWPQAKVVISKNSIVSLRCPSHVCHTCVSDDPKGKFQHLNNANITKCVKCPATYHMDSTCIPAGSKMLTAAHIICPRHATKMKSDANLNVNWCFICVRGGNLICCETCPTSVHVECLNIVLDPNEGYICDECESGRLPLYGEMVWAKFNVFRWWPAIILPPTEVPLNMLKKTHDPFEFVIRFFGTHDHGWISRRRVYLYLEGDDYSEPPRTKKMIDQSYSRGVIEAKQAYEIIKAKKLERVGENEDKEKLHPQPYVKIRVNRAVAPVKLHPDLEKVGKCDCKPDDESPCGPDTNCLNRVLYHECNPKICPAGDRCQNVMFETRSTPDLEIFYAKKERGFGLRCREAISAGTFVIEYVGEVINGDEFQRRMEQKSIDRDENYYFLHVEKDYIIDAGPKGNMARFMNHSCDPNCETQKWSVNGLSRVGLFAIRDIPANTELTFNYHWDELLGNSKKVCFCSSEKCTGLIGKVSKEFRVKNESSNSENESVPVIKASNKQQKRRKDNNNKATKTSKKLKKEDKKNLTT